MSTTEIAAVLRGISELRQWVDVLRLRHGDAAAVLRLADDVDRLAVDFADLGEDTQAPAPPVAAHQAGVVMLDTSQDTDLWRGSEDEGVGGHHPRGREKH